MAENATPEEAPAPSSPEKAHSFWTPQTKPLWIAILVLSAVLLSTISFSIGRMSVQHDGPGFRIERFDDHFPGQGPGNERPNMREERGKTAG